MREQELCRELSRKICKDLGASPYTIGKISLTHKDLLIQQGLKLSDEKDVVKNIPMWYGEAIGTHGVMCCTLAALEQDKENLEIAALISFKDANGDLDKNSTIAGIRYDWSDDLDFGTFLVKSNDKWLSMTLSQRLQLSLGLENMVQDGIMWVSQPNIPEEVRKNLIEVIEVDI